MAGLLLALNGDFSQTSHSWCANEPKTERGGEDQTGNPEGWGAGRGLELSPTVCCDHLRMDGSISRLSGTSPYLSRALLILGFTDHGTSDHGCRGGDETGGSRKREVWGQTALREAGTPGTI